MTEAQKAQRKELELRFRADKKGVARSFEALSLACGRYVSSGNRPQVFLYTDEHATYHRVLTKSAVPKTLVKHGRIKHIRIPSKRARTVLNPLFAVNYVDRQLRKDVAECVRETVCFGKNVPRSIDRLVVYLTYHNLFKPFREQQKLYYSHACAAGIKEDTVKGMTEGLFTERSFLGDMEFEGPYRKAWLREYVTPLKEKEEYLPHFAAA